MEIKKIQLLGAVFAILLMAGCASNQTAKDEGATTGAAGTESMQSGGQQAGAMSAEEQAKAQQQKLQAAADAAGNVVYFDFDQATLRPDTRATLDAHIALLKTNNKKIRLEGNTDERGTREYNMALGERRANAVANYMIINGIARYRIETVSYGEERPAVNGHNEAAWAKNRRVVIKYQ